LVFTGITTITLVLTGIAGVAVTITMPTSTMASIMAGITSDMAAATTMPEISMLVKGSMAAKGFMVVTKVGSMAGVAEDSMEAEGSAEGFTVVAEAEAIAKARSFAKQSGGNVKRDAKASRFFCARAIQLSRRTAKQMRHLS